MNDLDDLIKFENENTGLDFKAEQYLKPKYEVLIKDLMAMASANLSRDRYIVVGVKHHPDGTREYLGIDEKDFVDSATYHQLLRENVEPEIHFDYQPYKFEGTLLGVFRIYDCVDQPYMMRKAFGTGLRQGDSYIRKGSHQTRMMRRDFDRILLKKDDEGFTGVIRFGFDAPGTPKDIKVPAAGKIELPSDIAAQKIRTILAARQRGGLSQLQQLMGLRSLASDYLSGHRSYEQRTTEELHENLEKVKETYHKDDLYELYEVHGATINLVLTNEGDTYVEDTTLKLEIPRLEGLRVATKIHDKPERSGPFNIPIFRPNISWVDRYPSVKYHKEHIEVRASPGALRHGIPTLAFGKPIRIVLENNLIGQKIYLNCTLFGKQLRVPRTETLTIEVIEPSVYAEAPEQA